MTAMTRIAFAVVIAALASPACGSSGADALAGQGSSELTRLLGGLAARQVFTGTVVVKDSAASTSNASDTIGTSTTTRSLNHTVTFTVTKGSVVARIAYEEKSRVDSESRYQYHKVVGFKTEETTAAGTRSDGATVSVDLRADGSYQINFGSGGGVVGEYRMFDTSTTICTNLSADPTCRPGSTSSNDSGKPPSQGGVGGSVDGRLDRARPNVLVGSVTQRQELNDGTPSTRTVTWNLSR
jgi:hypothetical protein